MRILLIVPNYGTPPHNTKFWFYGHTFPPLGVEYIAAYVEDLAEVRIIDNRLKNMDLKVVEKTIDQFRPDYVGISCNYSSQVSVAFKIAEISKIYGSRTVLGGWHPTLVPDEILNSTAVDIVVRGEGEGTFRELIEKDSPVGVLGLSYKYDGKHIHNPDRDLLDLKQIWPPARYFRSAAAKVSYNFFGSPIECIEISRGCPYSCDFCSIHNFYRFKYRKRTIPAVIKELREIANTASIIFIVDDNFVVDPQYVVALCDAIIKSGIRTFFKTQVRVDSVVNHPEVFKKMADAGFLYLFLGFESFSDRTLEKLNKRIKFKEIKSAIKILHDLGYIIQGNVILGADLEDTKKDLESTIEIAKTLDIDMLSFTLLTVFPETKLMETIQKKGLLLTKDWREFDWLAPTIKYPHLTSEELKYYLTKAHQEIPFFDNPLRRLANSIRARGWKFFLSRMTSMGQIKFLLKNMRQLPAFYMKKY